MAVCIINKKKRKSISSEDEQIFLSSKLPDEIMHEILSRLPAEYLIQFKFISKSWNNLITKDLIFINMHLIHTQILQPQPEKLILRDSKNMFILYSLDFQQSGRLERLRPTNSRRLRYGYFNQIFGTCNGLVCTEGNPESVLCIRNPCTREYRQTPYGFKLDFDVGPTKSCFGFGYNSIVNDYVVVQLTYLVDNNQFDSAVAIYSLRNNSWRKFQNLPYKAISKAGQLVNGLLHWLATPKFISSKSILRARCGVPEMVVLLAFEISTEKFLEVPLPDLDYIKTTLMVSEYQGNLSIYLGKDSIHLDLWVMNDYGVKESWTKVFTIRRPQHLFLEVIPSALCSTKEGFILIQSDLDDTLYLYDHKYRTRRHIKGVHTWDTIRTYIPSIVTLNI